MKHTIPAAVILSMMVGGLAQAQTSTPSTATTTSPALTTPSATMGAAGTTATGTTTPGAALGTPSNSPAPAAVTTTSAPSRTTSAPVAGANSFTEAQARARIEERGFGQVANLKKDDQGVWRGTAMKDGKSATVSLDYQGNIVSQ